MDRFIKLIERVHKERYSVVMNKMIAEKIPVAFFSLAPINNAVDIVNKFRNSGVNVTTLITIEDSTPPLPI